MAALKLAPLVYVRAGEPRGQSGPLIYRLRELEDKTWRQTCLEILSVGKFRDIDKREIRKIYKILLAQIATPEIARVVLDNLKEE